MEKLKTIVREIIGNPQPGKQSPLNPDKLQLIDFAQQRLNMTSFADLGGVWNIDGGYSFYALGYETIKSGVLVDTDFTSAVFERQKRFPHLRLVEKNFGDPGILNHVGKIDAVFLFDTLLHQVYPDWDVILRLFSEVSRIFLIFNQQYVNLPKTTSVNNPLYTQIPDRIFSKTLTLSGGATPSLYFCAATAKSPFCVREPLGLRSG